MRMIAQFEQEAQARAFGDILYSRGIDNEVESEKESSWLVWVKGEEELDRARELLQQFRRDPGHADFQGAAREASRLRRESEKEDEAYRKRYHDARTLFPAFGGRTLGPLTLVLTALCALVYVLMQIKAVRSPVIQALSISSFEITGTMMYYGGLQQVLTGQVWRLFTPVLLHFGILHVFFNLLWLWDLGNMIESRRGTRQLLFLVLVIAALSNLGQFFWGGPNFGGMSGVVYGLLGYVWLKGKFDPASGLFLHPSTVTMMLIWFFLCLSGFMGNIANMAHAVGLGVGMLWGYLSAVRGR